MKKMKNSKIIINGVNYEDFISKFDDFNRFLYNSEYDVYAQKEEIFMEKGDLMIEKHLAVIRKWNEYINTMRNDPEKVVYMMLPLSNREATAYGMACNYYGWLD